MDTPPITDQAAAWVRVTDRAVKATHNHVVLADGTEFVVRTGQTRQLIAWDQLMSRTFDREKQPFVFAAFLAWHAAKREGFFPGRFEDFLDAVDELTPVRAADAEPEPAGEPVPPTTPTAPPA
jgi:hypothetical protein